MTTTNALEQKSEQAQAGEAMDDFGRTQAERTIELSPEVAEAINAEVEVGKHDSYTDALEHVLARGFAELKRTRDAQAKLRLTKARSEAMSKLSDYLALDPSLVTKPEAMKAVLAKLGIAG
jgi:hypothetical protein